MALKYRRGSKLPYSNATNAYALLSDVITTILEEPKRLNMDDWLMTGPYMVARCSANRTTAPACGTVGCISGWLATLTPQLNIDAMHGENIIAPLSVDLSMGQMRNAAYDMFLDTHVDARYGTLKYARIVAGHIRAFQKRWKSQLQSVVIAQKVA